MATKDNIPDSKAFLRMLDVASAIKRQKAEIKGMLDSKEQRAYLKEVVTSMASGIGENLSEQEIDGAVDDYLSGLYSFQNPKNTFQAKLAEMYTNRKRIGKRYGLPALGIVLIGSLAYGGLALTKTIQNNIRITRIESRVENSIYQYGTIFEESKSSFNSFESYMHQLDSSDQAQLKEIIESGSKNIASIEEFLEKYYVREETSQSVTKQNCEEIEPQLEAISKRLSDIQKDVNLGTSVIERHKGLVVTRKNLDSLIAEIQENNAPEAILKQAETAYKLGILNINNKKLNEAQQAETNLGNLKRESYEWAVLPAQLSNSYTNIQAIVKEPKAKSMADELYNQGKIYEKTLQVAPLKDTVKDLQDLEGILNNDYVISIINKERVKSGIDRYYTDENGKRVSGFYVIVEAIDSNGKIVPQEIKSEENGIKKVVSIWGERVPEAVYEQVKSDKIDNGIIEDNIFAFKEKGYLNPKILYQYNGRTLERTGQILEW
jgi:hypothetical protein